MVTSLNPNSKGKMNFCSHSSSFVRNLWRLFVISILVIYLNFVLFSNDPACTAPGLSSIWTVPSSSAETASIDHDDEVHAPTNVSHLAFALQGSEKTCHFRRAYTEAWWRPNITRGYVYLDTAPTGDLLPWSPKSPQYRISDDLSQMVREIGLKNALMPRFVHEILELLREEKQGIRWIIMGDDDTMFFVDNLVDVLSRYEHTKYYYIGYPSESPKSNVDFNYNMAFGGGGIILSYPLAKALVRDMDRCLRTYSKLSADLMIMNCLADIGVDFTPHKGMHQNDLRGDYSGFLSSHPKELVLSIHHWDVLDPIFPKIDRFQSARHLMEAGNVDQSRLFQQTICHHRETNWTFSVSWGYSVHIYEKVMARSWLMKPIETFQRWKMSNRPPFFMFNTRQPSSDSCEAPHLFFFDSIEKTSNNLVLTIYARSAPRNLSACSASGNHSAEFVSKIHVFSPPIKRPEIHRAECCDVLHVEGTGKAGVKFRECKIDEIIA